MAFLVAIAITTLLLMLPAARADGGAADFMTAFFTATSAVCVTGLIVVDTATYWSGFGQFVILLAFQIGGFGIMTAATLLGIAAGRSLHLSSRLLASAERSQIDFTDAASVLRLVFGATFLVESVLALILVLRLNMAHGEAWGTAVWNGVFHAISAFNNAGFSTYSDGLMGFQADGLFLWPMMLAITVSALGFPVLHELRHEWRQPKRWSLHTLAEWELRSKYGVTIVGIKRPREDFTYARPETRVEKDDLLIVSGRTDLVERFAALD